MIDGLELPTELAAASGTLTLRRATDDDLDELMRLLSDDPISAGRGDRARPEDREAYANGLRDVTTTPGNDLFVAVDDSGVIGTFQLTVLPGMARRGARRMQVEAVRVASARRSSGAGTAMMRWVSDVAAPASGCALIQLTSDSAREDAHRFYDRLGYVASHVGFKLSLPRAR
ncbi:GNAT family N-acetyltransferase [Microbacterium gorillae]|uniref:GNAT family N-acetyltransferase n=1 Tax=Microbacterium gorillae TaxID=1231063 RepID=UPI00058FAFD2|nr:GNAT family N-acetyltransferase [Microbacterium gorillae]